VAVVAGGAPAEAQVRLGLAHEAAAAAASPAAVESFGALRSAVVTLPAQGASELKVWAHTLTPEGNSEGLPVEAQLLTGAAGAAPVALPVRAGQALIPLSGPRVEVEIKLPRPEAA
jgi:hypothetical protein